MAHSEGMIRVLLADDDERYLGSLRELIEGQRELSVVGTATNGLTAIELVDELARTRPCWTCTCRSSTA